MGDDLRYKLAGTTFKDRYQIFSRFTEDRKASFKQGATAIVYRARVLNPQLGEPETVALKIFAPNPKLSTNPLQCAKFKEYFQAESAKLKAAAHPHVVQIYDSGEVVLPGMSEPILYQVLEFMAGGTLAELYSELKAANQSLTLNKVIAYLTQIIAAVANAHKRGIVHRDLKPSNILLNHDRSIIKISDFGSASTARTDGNSIHIGADNWAAPEHHPNKPPRPGMDMVIPASDVYTLGKLAYFMITGEVPSEYKAAQITSLPASIRNRKWADALLGVIKRATRLEPLQRYQSAEQFFSDLKEVFQNTPNTAPAPIPTTAPQTPWGYVFLASAATFIFTISVIIAFQLIRGDWSTSIEPAAQSTVSPTPLLPTGLVNLKLFAKTNVNLRSKPGDGEKLCVVNKGEAVILLGDSRNNWQRVRTTLEVSGSYSCGPGMEGWVYGQYWDLQPATP